MELEQVISRLTRKSVKLNNCWKAKYEDFIPLDETMKVQVNTLFSTLRETQITILFFPCGDHKICMCVGNIALNMLNGPSEDERVFEIVSSQSSINELTYTIPDDKRRETLMLWMLRALSD